jgi:hypothetical protein
VTGELSEKSTCAKIAQVAADGKTRQMNIYNLDVILSVGYRINSTKATEFRIWATNVLRQHLVAGYTINEKRLKAQQGKIRELQETLRLLGNRAILEGVSDEAKGIVQIIAEYSRALNILDDSIISVLPRQSENSKSLTSTKMLNFNPLSWMFFPQ